MSDEQKARENEVFDQAMSLEDLDAATGGSLISDECTDQDKRNINGGNGFPHCAATVEADSWCWKNDACELYAIEYVGMTSCSRAWK